MPFPVFFDTCTLFGEIPCDIILRLAEERFFMPYWSNDILVELERNLAPRIGSDHARQRIEAMTRAFPDASVSGYEPLIESMRCDVKDRHVLAAACLSPAQTLVTFNIKDFPPESTAPMHIEVRKPDDFLMDVLDLNPRRVGRVCLKALHSYHTYPQTPLDFAAALEKSGLREFAANIYRILEILN